MSKNSNLIFRKLFFCFNVQEKKGKPSQFNIKSSRGGFLVEIFNHNDGNLDFSLGGVKYKIINKGKSGIYVLDSQALDLYGQYKRLDENSEIFRVVNKVVNLIFAFSRDQYYKERRSSGSRPKPTRQKPRENSTPKKGYNQQSANQSNQSRQSPSKGRVEPLNDLENAVKERHYQYLASLDFDRNSKEFKVLEALKSVRDKKLRESPLKERQYSKQWAERLLKSAYEAINGVGSSKGKAPKKIYHSLSLQFHPDRNDNPLASSIFQMISSANEITSQSEREFIGDIDLNDVDKAIPAGDNNLTPRAFRIAIINDDLESLFLLFKIAQNNQISISYYELLLFAASKGKKPEIINALIGKSEKPPLEILTKALQDGVAPFFSYDIVQDIFSSLTLEEKEALYKNYQDLGGNNLEIIDFFRRNLPRVESIFVDLSGGEEGQKEPELRAQEAASPTSQGGYSYSSSFSSQSFGSGKEDRGFDKKSNKEAIKSLYEMLKKGTDLGQFGIINFKINNKSGRMSFVLKAQKGFSKGRRLEITPNARGDLSVKAQGRRTGLMLFLDIKKSKTISQVLASLEEAIDLASNSHSKKSGPSPYPRAYSKGGDRGSKFTATPPYTQQARAC